MLFAQITDMHITTREPSPFAGRCPSKQLKKIINYLNTFPQRIEFVLLSGDCVDKGYPQEYALLNTLLNELTIPYYIIPGNHDERSHLREAFPVLNQLSADPFFIHYALENYPVRFIGLDTVREYSTPGEMCEKRLQWLDETLYDDRRKPTVIFMHHPPIQTGLPILDENGFPAPERLGDILRSHPQVKNILCGHFHRPMQSIWQGIPVSVIGSSVAQIAPDFSPAAPVEWSDEPPGFALHWWKGSLLTQFCSLGTAV
jgi:3',5'-cyclic AMP phosphodiesterase CpdA